MPHNSTRLLRAALLAVFALGVFPAAALTQDAAPPPDPHAAKPERPTVATHAFVIAPGYVEIEAGLQRTPLGGGVSQLSTSPLVKIGLAKDLQLDIAPSWVRTSGDGNTTSGIGDTTVGVKWHVVDGLPVIGTLGLQGTLTLPSGSYSEGTGTGTTGANFLVISSHNVHGVAVDINVGYTRRSGNGEQAPKSSTVWTLSSGWPVSGPVGFSLELFGYPATSGPAGGEAQVGLLFGPTWTVVPSVVLDAGAILNVRGLQGTSVYAGITWNVGKAWTAR